MADNPFADLVPAAAPQQAKANPFADLVPAKDASTAPKSVGAALKHGLLDEPYQDVMERTSEAQAALVHDLTTKPEMNPVGLAGRAAKTGLDVMGGAWSPIQGGIDYLFGRPVSDLTGNRISKETAGDVAGLVVPIGLEAKAAQAAGKAPILAKEASAFAKGKTSPVLSKVLAKPKTELQKNVADLEKVGADPSLVVATPSRTLHRIGSALNQNMAGLGLIGNRVGQTRDALAEHVGQTARKIGVPTTAEKAGAKLQSAVEKYSKTTPAVRQAIEAMPAPARAALTQGARSIPSRSENMGFGTKSELLYDRAEQAVKKTNAPIDLPNTRAAMNDVVHEFSAPQLSEVFKNSNLDKLHQSMTQLGDKLTWDDAKSLRTKIRERLMGDPQLRGTVSDAQVDKIYRGLTQDLAAGAEKLGGPKAKRAWEQANKFYATGMDRVEGVLGKVYGTTNAGDIVHNMLRYATSGRGQNTLMLNQVKRSVPAEVWRDFSASVLDNMGKALPGKAAMEDEFSANTFLTNFNKLKADGGAGFNALFESGGRGPDLATVEKMASKANANRDAIEDAARVARQLRSLDKSYNHSQSGAHMANMATTALLGGSLLTHNPYAIAMAWTTGPAASYAMQSPKVVKWLANLPAKPTSMKEVGKAMAELKQIAGKDPALNAYYHQLDATMNQQQQPQP